MGEFGRILDLAHERERVPCCSCPAAPAKLRQEARRARRKLRITRRLPGSRRLPRETIIFVEAIFARRKGHLCRDGLRKERARRHDTGPRRCPISPTNDRFALRPADRKGGKLGLGRRRQRLRVVGKAAQVAQDIGPLLGLSDSRKGHGGARTAPRGFVMN